MPSNDNELNKELRQIIHDNLSHPDDYQPLIDELEHLITQHTASVERESRIEKLQVLLDQHENFPWRKIQEEEYQARKFELERALAVEKQLREETPSE